MKLIFAFIFCVLFFPPQNGLKPATSCKIPPPWFRDLNVNPARTALLTNERRVTGLALIEYGANKEKKKVYQHPTWDDAGNLGILTTSHLGILYVTPWPKINLLGNDPKDQNILHYIDPQTQELKSLIDIPIPKNKTNSPYGLLGVTYYCEANMLYTASVAGSTYTEERGKIYAVSLDNTGRKAKIADHIEGDAMGLLVVNLNNQKRLLFGKARTSELWSVQIDENGKFAGQPRKELSIFGLGPKGDDKVKKINFNRAGELVLNCVTFDYNLATAHPNISENNYRFKYINNRWMFAGY